MAWLASAPVVRSHRGRGKKLRLAAVYAIRPDDFAGGELFTPEAPLVDDCWTLEEVGWPELTVHPLHIVDDEDLQLVRLWRQHDHGHGPLPSAGGSLDQSSSLMACFDILDAVETALIKKHHG